MTPLLHTTVVERWRRFWFERIPPHSYALLRILVGVVGISTLLGAWKSEFWRLDGIVPLAGAWGMRPWLIAHGLGAVSGLLLRWGLLAGYVCLAVGFGARIVAIAMFAGSAAMLQWNWLPFSGAQELLHHLTFPLVFVDSGAVWSVDALTRSRQAVAAQPRDEPVWPLRLLQYQLAIMYLSAALWKLGNPDWRSGLALHYVLNNPLYQRDPGGVPAAWFGATIALTFLTLAWELAFPILIWFRRTRVPMLLVGLALHVGMWATIEVGAFTPTVLVAYVAFLDPRRIEDRVKRMFGALPGLSRFMSGLP